MCWLWRSRIIRVWAMEELSLLICDPLIGRKEWETEINVLGAVEHPNLVKLIGYCADDDETRTQLLLVYEYMVNGSVEDHLYAKSKTPLSWTMRLKVAQDAARGLTYLHEELDVQIVLRDFKPSNILLDDQWNAKLADFGLAMLRPQQENSQVSTRPGLGTMGYIAPEYFIEGHHTFKSDVWSYGVFLYELITGRRPIDCGLPLKEQMLIEWVKPYVESKRFNQIVDRRLLKGNYPLESAEKLSIIADKCLSANPKSRPKMSEVLVMVNQLVVRVPSQATSAASPLVPQVASDPNKTFMGPNQGEKTKETKHEGRKCSMKIQLKKHACMPRMCPMKLLKSCSEKSCCVSLH
ncbi:putative protein kinase RLK-Pelle-RLCK-VIIa-2 family [Helianthus annuus]|nr:putative protein kinase RLK-Pelle-RLCK-VIIa-2 family [Helianthus annuus]